MIKPFLAAASVLLACGIAYSQNVVIDTRPAHEGKALTMEEAIYKGAGYSRMPRLSCRPMVALATSPQSGRRSAIPCFRSAAA